MRPKTMGWAPVLTAIPPGQSRAAHK
jgi:hypothetical protein